MKSFQVILIGLLLNALFCASARANSEIRIAYQPTPLYAPLFVAKAKGWIEEELAKTNQPNAKIRWASFAAGPAMNESFAAQQQDIGFMGDTPALIGKSVGIDTRIVGISVSGPKGLGLIVPKDSKFSSVSDLKGKKVAVTKGSFAQHFLVLLLEKEGVSMSDIELVNMPPSEIAPAIMSNAIDAGATWEPYIMRYESEKSVRILADGEGLKKGTQPIIASSDAVKTKRPLVEAVLKAYARGAALVRSNPKEAALLASKDASLSADLLEKVFAKQNFAPPLTDDDVTEFKRAEAYMRKAGLLKAPVDVESWIDRSFESARGAK